MLFNALVFLFLVITSTYHKLYFYTHLHIYKIVIYDLWFILMIYYIYYFKKNIWCYKNKSTLTIFFWWVPLIYKYKSSYIKLYLCLSVFIF